MNQNKGQAIKTLTLVIEKAFAAGHPVAFGEDVFVQRRAGEEIETETDIFQAIDNGIFKLCKTSRHTPLADSVEAGEVCLKYFDHGDADLLVQRYQEQMSVRDIDEMMIGLTAKNVLTEMAQEKRRPKVAAVDQAEVDPRERSLQILRHVVGKAFAAGHSVVIGDGEYLQKRRGEEIETDTHLIEILESGIFKKCPRISTDRSTGAEVRSDAFLRFYDHGDIDGLISRTTASMSIRDIDESMVGISAKTVLTQMAHEKRRSREMSTKGDEGYSL